MKIIQLYMEPDEHIEVPDEIARRVIDFSNTYAPGSIKQCENCDVGFDRPLGTTWHVHEDKERVRDFVRAQLNPEMRLATFED